MENFEEMLEQYLDEQEIQSKIELDRTIDVEDVNCKRKTASNFLNTITISEFVTYYLGTEHDCKDLKHKGLKSFNNPYVIGISNDFAVKNPDCIRRQEILVVIDFYGNPGTYINPVLLKDLEDMEEYKNIMKLLNSVRIHNMSEVSVLYNEYMKILNQMNELEQQYINGCDLLTQLQKKSLLRQIKKYAKKASQKGLELANLQNEILETIKEEDTILFEGKKLVLGKED